MKKHLQTPSQRGSASFVSLIDMNILRRAAIVAIVLGSVLTLVNQTGAVFGGGSLQILPFVLVYLTPFMVVTISQGLGIRRARQDRRRDQTAASGPQAFVTTALSHGIPFRSLLLGLIVGAVNTAIVITAAVGEGAALAALPLPVIGQAFVLPMLFGLLSQTISYRRAGAALAIGERRQINLQPISA